MYLIAKCDGTLKVQEPKIAIAGSILFLNSNEDIDDELNPVACMFKYIEGGTSNIAELTAITIAFELAFCNGKRLKSLCKEFFIMSDSELAVNLCKGVFRPHQKSIKKLVHRIEAQQRALTDKYPNITVHYGWNNRKENTTADMLCTAVKRVSFDSNSRMARVFMKYRGE